MNTIRWCGKDRDLDKLPTWARMLIINLQATVNDRTDTINELLEPTPDNGTGIRVQWGSAVENNERRIPKDSTVYFDLPGRRRGIYINYCENDKAVRISTVSGTLLIQQQASNCMTVNDVNHNVFNELVKNNGEV